MCYYRRAATERVTSRRAAPSAVVQLTVVSSQPRRAIVDCLPPAYSQEQCCRRHRRRPLSCATTSCPKYPAGGVTETSSDFRDDAAGSGSASRGAIFREFPVLVNSAALSQPIGSVTHSGRIDRRYSCSLGRHFGPRSGGGRHPDGGHSGPITVPVPALYGPADQLATAVDTAAPSLMLGRL